MNLSLQQKQTHRRREQTCGCQGGGEWRRDGFGVQDQQIQLLSKGWTNNKVLLRSTGSCIEYPVINHNGKEYKKECVYA